ncbi:hypothetical protein DSECCO2_478940 [anaerobic digester metagenome]
MSCTSKWRILRTRLLASRVRAKTSGSRESSSRPPATSSRQAAMRAGKSASDRACMAGSKELTCSTMGRRDLRYLSFLDPNIFLVK